MKTISKIALISVVIILSCASCKSTSFYTYTSRSEKINSVQLQATTTLVDIDVDFQHRVIAESGWCLNEKNAKDEALYNATIQNKIDIIVDPIFKTEYNSRTKQVKVSVVGFAGKYVNPRPAIQDIQQLKDVDMENIEKHVILNNPSVLPALKQSKENNVTINNYSEKK